HFPYLVFSAADGPEIDPLSILRPAWRRVVSGTVGPACWPTAIRVYDVDLPVSTQIAVEGNLSAVRRPAWTTAICGDARQLHGIQATAEYGAVEEHRRI